MSLQFVFSCTALQKYIHRFDVWQKHFGRKTVLVLVDTAFFASFRSFLLCSRTYTKSKNQDQIFMGTEKPQ